MAACSTCASCRSWTRSSRNPSARAHPPQGLEHPNPSRYAGQRIFVVRREDYVYLVPFVEDEHRVFLKAIIPSGKATKQYLGEEYDDEDGR